VPFSSLVPLVSTFREVGQSLPPALQKLQAVKGGRQGVERQQSVWLYQIVVKCISVPALAFRNMLTSCIPLIVTPSSGPASVFGSVKRQHICKTLLFP
jgi:hypothetical protein